MDTHQTEATEKQPTGRAGILCTQCTTAVPMFVKLKDSKNNSVCTEQRSFLRFHFSKRLGEVTSSKHKLSLKWGVRRLLFESDFTTVEWERRTLLVSADSAGLSKRLFSNTWWIIEPADQMWSISLWTECTNNSSAVTCRAHSSLLSAGKHPCIFPQWLLSNTVFGWEVLWSLRWWSHRAELWTSVMSSTFLSATSLSIETIQDCFIMEAGRLQTCRISKQMMTQPSCILKLWRSIFSDLTCREQKMQHYPLKRQQACEHTERRGKTWDCVWQHNCDATIRNVSPSLQETEVSASSSSFKYANSCRDVYAPHVVLDEQLFALLWVCQTSKFLSP